MDRSVSGFANQHDRARNAVIEGSPIAQPAPAGLLSGEVSGTTRRRTSSRELGAFKFLRIRLGLFIRDLRRKIAGNEASIGYARPHLNQFCRRAGLNRAAIPGWQVAHLIAQLAFRILRASNQQGTGKNCPALDKEPTIRE